jgi:UDP-glucuronate decarboxylase
MRVLVTGASGFIGAHVTRALLSKSHQVAVLVVPGDPMVRLFPERDRIKKITGTLEDDEILKNALKTFKPEACIHLAWYAEPGLYLDSKQNIQSLVSSLSLFQLLIKEGCLQIVAAGTCFEYATNFGYLREDTPTVPENLYAASKLSCCLMGNSLLSLAKIPFAWGRIFFPYGPQEDPRRLVQAAIMALRKGIPFQASRGDQIRDYIHVTDVASAFCTLLERKAQGVYNISSGIPVSIRQLLDTLGEILKRKELIQMGVVPERRWDPPFICGDNKRLRALGWQPRYPLEHGLTETIHWKM